MEPPPRSDSTNPAPDTAAERIAAGLEQLSRVVQQHAWQDAHARGLTPTQGRILTFLADRPGTSLGDVAERLGVRSATASDAVRVLDQKGLVQKSKHPDDRRILWLQPTPEGKKMARRTAEWPQLLADAAGELSDTETTILLRSVLRMIRSLQLAGHVQRARICPTCIHFRPHAHEDPRRPHHCALVDAAFGDLDLRVDCIDHQQAMEADAEASFRRFAAESD